VRGSPQFVGRELKPEREGEPWNLRWEGEERHGPDSATEHVELQIIGVRNRVVCQQSKRNARH
jgi:hypothetical protein